ncbi:MAG: PEP-CTERM sorting domain-containing protein [Isosphaeraceae bacterium]
MPLFRSSLAAVLVIGLAASAQAVVIVPPITFGGDASFNAPAVQVGTATITSTTPTITNTSFGFNLSGPAYDLTAGSTAGQTNQTLWSSDRQFTVTDFGPLTNTSFAQSIVGSTSVTGTGGQVSFNVTGSIYSVVGETRTKLSDVVFQDWLTPSATAHSEVWNLTSSPVSLVTGALYDLVMTSKISWTDVPAGATLHLASDYNTGINPTAVPEPASLLLTSLGLIGLAWSRRRSWNETKKTSTCYE